MKKINLDYGKYRAFPPGFLWIVILFLSFFSGMKPIKGD
jgi:hypothetical protein